MSHDKKFLHGRVYVSGGGAGPYPEVDAGGGGGGYSRGYSLFQAATPFWGRGCSIYKIYIFLWHPGGGLQAPQRECDVKSAAILEVL